MDSLSPNALKVQLCTHWYAGLCGDATEDGNSPESIPLSFGSRGAQLLPDHGGLQREIAEVYSFRNQSDEAFEWLDRAYTQRDDDLIVTKVDPFLKNLHNDPRYAAFLKKLNLPT
jgi:hypothetical protein